MLEDKINYLAFFFVGYLLFASYVVEYLHISYTRDEEADKKNHYSHLLSLVRTKLESAINSDIYLAESLATIITLNPELTKAQWQIVANELMRKSHHLVNIGIAPNDIITFVHPLEGNERIIGFDFRNVPEQWESVERARAQRRLTINGPLNLIQGGQGLIGRVPIFSRLTNNEYWGSSSVVINLQALYEYSGLIEFAKQANIALRKQVSVDGDGQIFYGDESTFADAFLSDVVTLPEGYWAIAISLKDDDNASFFAAHIVRSVGYVVVIILWFCFYLTYKAYQLARASSLRDELTTLPNRRYVMELLKRLASSERVTSSKFSVLNIDFNKFKTINDSYGHAAGDIVLVEVAKRLTACLRSSDTVARLGGDEFLVVLPRVSEAKELAYIIEKIKDTCKQPVIYNDIELSISLSIGSAVFLKDSDDLDKLLSMADQNMYNNKYMVKG